jgi:hypothetical protein
MGKKYLGFCIREVETTKNWLGKKIKREQFSNVQVGADNFAEAQQTLCDSMAKYNMTVGIIFPYYKREGENEILADF